MISTYGRGTHRKRLPSFLSIKRKTESKEKPDTTESPDGSHSKKNSTLPVLAHDNHYDQIASMLLASSPSSNTSNHMCRASGLPTAIECSRAAHISDDENSWVKETTEELDIASEVAKSGLLERDFGDPPQVPPKSMLRANSSNVVHRPYGLDSITDCSYQATRSGIMTRSAVSSPVIFTREDADRDVRAMSNLALCQASRDIPKKQKSLICRTISFGSRLIQSRHQTGNKQDLSAPATGSSPFIKKARAFLRPSIEFSPRRDESLNNRETMSKSASTSWQRHRESLDSQLSNHRFDSPRHDQDLLLTPSVHHETLASSQRPMLGVTPSLTFGETLTTPTSTKHLHVGTGFCLPSEQQHTDSLVSASPDAVSGPRLRIHTISGTDEQASSIASTESDPFVDTGSYSIANLDNSFCPQSSSLKRSSSHISSSDLSSTSESFEVPISNDTRSEVRRKKHPTPSAIHWEILETTMTDYAHGRITQAEAEARVHKTAFASPRSRMKRARNSAHQTGNLLADRFEAEVDELQMEEVSFA